MEYNGITVSKDSLRQSLDEFRDSMFNAGNFNSTDSWGSYNKALDCFFSNYLAFSELVTAKIDGEVIDERVFSEKVNTTVCAYIWARIFKKLLVKQDAAILDPESIGIITGDGIDKKAEECIANFKQCADGLKRLSYYETGRWYRHCAAHAQKRATCC